VLESFREEVYPVRKIPQDTLSDWLKIIGPSETEVEACSREIQSAFDVVVWATANPGLMSAKHEAAVMGSVAALIKQLRSVLPLLLCPWFEALLPRNSDLSRLEPRLSNELAAADEPYASEPPALKRLRQQSGAEADDETIKMFRQVVVYLVALLRRAEAEVATKRRSGSPGRIDKTFAATEALSLLRRFASGGPTLTAEGPFFNLATALYEKATGEASANLDWQCRQAFRRSR
jgi:hypothetical protein